ncbi:MAG: ribonuclease HI [Calothrix sp. MO_192.B10]|nr:ribonuclease HI [Calothrix sp. MO_192.B10]
MSPVRTIQSIYTDGACTGNPGPGGWGAVIYFSDGSIHEMGESCAQTTNNRMEMQAAIAALQYLQTSGQKEPIILYTDSEYLINCVTKWVKGWKAKGWKKADGKPVLNQDLLVILDGLNSRQIKWQYVRGHAGNVGNERCDAIARAFANGTNPSLTQTSSNNSQHNNEINLAAVSDGNSNHKRINENTHHLNNLALNKNMIDSSSATAVLSSETTSSEIRMAQIRNLVETLRVADEIAAKGYLITSSELADLMDVHASAVTSRGDQWRWRNWVVSRVRREGNQILWELERGDLVHNEDEN